MHTVNSTEFNDRFTGYSKSDIDNNIHGNGNRCKRLHGINTGYGECESASCSYGCTTSHNMCPTTIANTDGHRSNNIHMDTVNSTEFNDRFTGYSKSDIDNNIHGNGNRCKRLHGINTGYGECESASCRYRKSVA